MSRLRPLGAGARKQGKRKVNSERSRLYSCATSLVSLNYLSNITLVLFREVSWIDSLVAERRSHADCQLPIGLCVELTVFGKDQSEIGNQKSAMFYGGEGGIRTHGTVSRSQHFQCCQFNHSCTSPRRISNCGFRIAKCKASSLKFAFRNQHFQILYGGEGGIRTHGGR
jgi:hypothetical protein